MAESIERLADYGTARTRLAPSPTGALHLGNVRTFIVNWAMARQNNWQIILRVDDLDGPRTKLGADRQAIEMLRWIGLDWDEGPYYQTDDLAAYRETLRQLAAAGQIYPCRCSRSEILAAQSAPHGDDHELRYSGTCRPRHASKITTSHIDDEKTAWRLRVPDEETAFFDEFKGNYACNVQADVGDFLVATKSGSASYQMAVVIDDARQRINRIVRGDDLLSSTPRQLLLYAQLQLGPPPKYWHLPLVVGIDGRRLAKRHGDSRLIHYRQQGVRASRIIGLLAEWCGVAERSEMTPREFLDGFQLQRVPRQRIVFSEADDRWLRESCQQ